MSSLTKLPKPPLGARPDDIAEIELLVRRSGSSFYYGMRMLEPERRAAVYTIYAFCRVVDDIADEPGALVAKREMLDGWRDRVHALLEGRTDSALTRMMLLATRKFDLRSVDFLAIIDGMQMDAEREIVAPTMATLDLYCDRVASAVGRLSVRAFGDSSPAADRVAWCLGRALQLTNILRDIGEDAARSRLYLPREWLGQAGVPLNPQAAVASPGLPAVCARVADLARDYYRGAEEAMALCDPRAMKPARMMAAPYRALLGRMERTGFARPAERVSLPKWQKAWFGIRMLTA
ncbi:MAG TPA: presqualene diphosphate synthase HpnD [Acidisoma sp.]|uniref:presqualene diphosphate synthase HpnD n=1 Tax=Acidisoma sp. TaxID=1872115 RepID=UPI002BAA89FF|nr:presqualene diphosphate synthase HpnD [Acidisoma sp.]HTI03589.1 presqualene diphosphate synthase HpnD [Acidisoma sp.]